ncbi:hypothetical protein Ptr902_12651 [Pyrenophora tritici-repentis]|nr:hypothetical protein Ptr902_12651 [Pyrenophora tritici-repentis]
MGARQLRQRNRQVLQVALMVDVVRDDAQEATLAALCRLAVKAKVSYRKESLKRWRFELRERVVLLNEPAYYRESKALGIEARKLVGNRLSDSNRAIFKYAAEEAFLYSNWRLPRRVVAMARPPLL